MKKIFLNLLAAAVLLILLDQAFGLLLDAAMSRCGSRFARLYRDRDLYADVVALGDSRAVNSFNSAELTRLTDLKWFNLGYNGMDPVIMEAMIADYLELHGKPRLFVLEISNLRGAAVMIRDMRIFERYSPRLAAIDSRANGMLARLSAMSPLLSCNSEMYFRLLNYMRCDDQGWINSGIADPATFNDGIENASLRVMRPIEQECLDAYGRIFNLLKANGCRWCCVYSPHALNDSAKKHVRGYTDAMATKTGAGNWIDSIDDITAVEMFADPLHINRVGSVAYAQVLIAKMRANGAITSPVTGP